MRQMKPITPGEVLLEDYLKPLGVSQYRLAKSIKVPASRIHDVIHGRRAITPNWHCDWPGSSARTPNPGSICKRTTISSAPNRSSAGK